MVCDRNERKGVWKMERKQTATQSQKLMIFVLTMSLYGLATLFIELIPKFQVGIVEFSVEYFLFIPLTLAILFDPLSTALGAAMGELVFSEIMLGQFGGLGELEKFITVTIGVYIAGKLVRNPKNKKIVGIAAMSGVVIKQVLGMIVDILKVQFAVEEFEAVPGLPESVIFTEGFSCLNDVVFSGVLFCLLPTLFLVPKLYGKIEPLLGMQPRTEKTMVETINAKAIIYSVLAFLGAISAEMLAENGFELIDWEAKWAESSSSFAIGMIVASVLAIVMLIIMKKKAESSVSKKEVA